MTRTIQIIALIATLTTAATAEDSLLLAISDYDTAAVRHEVMLRSDVDVTDSYGNTALMIASAYGYHDVVAILVHAGADVNAKGRIGNTALIVAVQNGHAEVARQLLDAEALVDVANNYGTNARELAIGHGHREIAEMLNEIPVDQVPNTLLAYGE